MDSPLIITFSSITEMSRLQQADFSIYVTLHCTHCNQRHRNDFFGGGAKIRNICITLNLPLKHAHKHCAA